MALQRQPSDLKNRVNTCLNRLSDRDTLTVATNELESIARNLNSEGFGAFLTCISNTDSSDKSPVRRQCVRLIGVLSASHGDALSPHLGKMLSSVLRRLRDPDSAVRSACVEAVSSIASEITQPPFSSILKPLIDAIMHEQDNNSQIGASLCLAAAIEASPDPEPAELKKLLLKLLKLVKNDSFKAKSALLSLIGSIVSVGGASSKNVLNSLVPITVEFLSSDDWTVRKAAAKTLGRLAVAERELLSELKAFCITSLDNRRFDKVKVVREMMNRALEWWKEVASTSDDGSQSKFAPKDCGSGACSPTPSKSSSDTARETPHRKKATRPSKSPASSSSSSITSQKNNSIRFRLTKSNVISSCKLDLRKSPDAKLKRTVSLASSLEVDDEDEQKSQNPRVQESADTVSCSSSNSEVKSTLFNKPPDGKFHRYGNSRSSSRVVPLCEDYNYNMDVPDGNINEDALLSHKEYENFCSISKQLVQIENQQSSLLNLLQGFIGSSRNGMSSLEKRVNGLERLLDEMQHDLGITTGRISNTDFTGSTCFMLPRAEFLSPKFWRSSEGQNSISRISFSTGSQNTTMYSQPETDATTKMLNQENLMGQKQNKNLSSLNHMGVTQNERNLSLHSNSNRRKERIARDGESAGFCHVGRLTGASFANCIQQQT
ncbi:TORTIFOLIA1-like protein 4 [Nicotiana tabacum]|uniref:Microtubule-associated protein TORTIFOLIA1-like n=1 Tax=Nicotiana tabacum TaxID=4097 RepID=A0A1S4BKQ0_TOBAC|nr:PREDICTED: microtubule-associated protein TORTIFOLIA1-like [Nicotiana tabacum]XP_016489456.1 PREDICTED: microtubule-associated protein TORTIFOLIA1-like [Nicotiana tabacum]